MHRFAPHLLAWCSGVTPPFVWDSLAKVGLSCNGHGAALVALAGCDGCRNVMGSLLLFRRHRSVVFSGEMASTAAAARDARWRVR